jgi:hypothetical protein
MGRIRSAAVSVRFILAGILVLLSFAAHAADLPTQLRIDHSLRFRHHTITIDFAETDGTVYVALFRFALDAVGFDPETTLPKRP